MQTVSSLVQEPHSANNRLLVQSCDKSSTDENVREGFSTKIVCTFWITRILYLVKAQINLFQAQEKQ
jgi:hypothetical protein